MYHLLQAKERKSKKSLRAMRQENGVPAVIYGKEMDSLCIEVSAKDFQKHKIHTGQILEVGLNQGTKHLVNLEEIQRDPVSGKILHASFHKLNKNQDTVVAVPLKLTGNCPGQKEGGVVLQTLKDIDIKGRPDKIPDAIIVNVEGLNLHGSIHLNEIALPEGVEFAHPEDNLTVASCQPPKAEKEPEVEAPANEVATEEVSAEKSETPGEEKKEEKAA